MKNFGPAATRVATARTLLFVPGDRPDRFAKAAASGADLVIIDLEDAVAAKNKECARTAAAEWIAAGNDAVVRVNAPRTAWYPSDISSLATHALAIMVPKAESCDDWAGCDLPIIPLIETARGVAVAAYLLEGPEVVRPAFGSIDLSVEIGVDPGDHTALLYTRSCLVLAAAATGCAPPIDGVTPAVRDEDALRRDVEHARRLGFSAKLCVHPAQIGPTRELLRPTAEEVSWARRVVDEARDGAALVDGEMVDAPVLARAQGVLERNDS